MESTRPAIAAGGKRQVRTLAVVMVLIAAVAVAQWRSIEAWREWRAKALVTRSDGAKERRLFASAHDTARLAMENDPYNGYAAFYEGTNEFVQENFQKAIPALTSALTYMPHVTNVLRLLGQSYFHLKQYEPASKAFERYFAMDPEPKVTPDIMHSLRAQALYRAGHYGAAAVQLARAEDYQSEESEVLAQSRLCCALLLNEESMADYFYRRLRNRFPQSDVALAELFSGALYENKLPGMLRFFEVLRMRGDIDPRTLQYLALSYIKGGRWNEALTVLLEAERLGTKDPEFYMLMGDVYYEKGDRRRAGEYYARHLKLKPDSRYREEIKRKMGGQLP